MTTSYTEELTKGDGLFRRLVAITTILAALLASASDAFSFAASPYAGSSASIRDPASAFPIYAVDGDLLRWAMVLDIFGYYLLLAPLALLLWGRLRLKCGASFASLFTFCGLAYVLIGAIGAASLSAVAPPLIDAYQEAPGQQSAVLEAVYYGFMRVVMYGLWELLGLILGGVWWLGIGLALWNELPKALAVLSAFTGIFALLTAVSRVVDISTPFAVALSGILLLIPVWSLVFGIHLFRWRFPESEKPTVSTRSTSTR